MFFTYGIFTFYDGMLTISFTKNKKKYVVQHLSNNTNPILQQIIC